MDSPKTNMTLIKSVFKGERLHNIMDAMEDIGVYGMTVWEVKGHGRQKGHIEHYRGLKVKVNLLPKVIMEIVAPDEDVDRIVKEIVTAARTGNIGDGKIFLLPVKDAVRIRTGDNGTEAL
jgi:nitrogen regulatory protein P-II 1